MQHRQRAEYRQVRLRQHQQALACIIPYHGNAPASSGKIKLVVALIDLRRQRAAALLGQAPQHSTAPASSGLGNEGKKAEVFGLGTGNFAWAAQAQRTRA